MLKNYRPQRAKTESFYELVFDDGHNNGFGFPCDRSGRVSEDLGQDAKDNIRYCLEHPEKFIRWNEVIRFENRYIEPARGTCSCGREVELWDQYYGSCQCDCGKWYNLFGQELVAPEYWETDPADEEYYSEDF